MKKALPIIISLLLLTVCASYAKAEKANRNLLGFTLGYSLPTSAMADGTGNQIIDRGVDDAILFGANLSLAMNETLSFEGAVEYHHHGMDEDKLLQSEEIETWILPITAGLSIGDGNNVRPYAELGAGLYVRGIHQSFQGFTRTGTFIYDCTMLNPGCYLGGGLQLKAFESVQFVTAVRWNTVFNKGYQEYEYDHEWYASGKWNQTKGTEDTTKVFNDTFIDAKIGLMFDIG